MTIKTFSNKKLVNINNTQQHPFHVLHSSKLPIIVASIAGSLALIFIIKLHEISFSNIFYFSSIISTVVDPFFAVDSLTFFSTNILIICFLVFLLIAIWGWSLNLFKEASYQGHHTLRVQTALKYGMLLFLLSEAMLFFPFFWAFFHGSLSPAITIGGIWPPVGIKYIETLNPTMLPLVNTLVLLSSGITLVAAHRSILLGHKSYTFNMMYLTISLGIFFSWLQFLEYGLTKFTLNDGLYGSVFFMLTGLHGFHVVVGTCLLLISYWRISHNNFSTKHHIGFELAAWYWHFVDVVWLFVYTFIYIWAL
jgi:cytochrome c oxidase subunit 3